MDHPNPQKPIAAPPARTGGSRRTDDVLPFGALADALEEEVPVGLPVAPVGARAPKRATGGSGSAVDLSGKPKVWFVIGRGRTGKTMLLRWLAEQVALAGSQALLADMDQTNATLSSYVDGVQRPPAGGEDAATAWLEKLLGWAMQQRASALIDLGGGDITLRRLVADVPDLVASIEAAGIAPIAVYLLGPRTDDLSLLASLEAGGFHPKATALILNEGLLEAGQEREDAFVRVTRHSAFRAAFNRGAVALWMPRLGPAAEIETRRVHFAQARDGVTREGRKQTPLGPFDRSRVRAWLADMDAEFGEIRSWIP